MKHSPGELHALSAEQQPNWPNPGEVGRVQTFLSALPPLTTPAAVRALSEQLRLVQSGGAFVVQAGDCAEPFGSAAVLGARGKHRALAAMADTLTDALRVPVVRVGRLAGQFAKPRSHPLEIVDGTPLPSFRGLIINGPEPVAEQRLPDPHRMLSGYHTARLVLDELANLADRGPAAGRGAGADAGGAPGAGRRRMWVSHEALLLDYEEPFVRRDVHTGLRYLLSTELPWIGERTRRVDGAHVRFLARVANPVACKIGPAATVDDVLGLCEALAARQPPGRLTFIARMGAKLVDKRLPPLVRAVRRAGYPVIWMCDPMHGNQIKTDSGLKTRRVSDVVDELGGFVSVMRDCDQWPGGVHLEIAGGDVTECLWEKDPSAEEHLDRAYRSLCDGRLNDAQTRHVTECLAAFLADGPGADGPGADGPGANGSDAGRDVQEVDAMTAIV